MPKSIEEATKLAQLLCKLDKMEAEELIEYCTSLSVPARAELGTEAAGLLCNSMADIKGIVEAAGSRQAVMMLLHAAATAEKIMTAVLAAYAPKPEPVEPQN